MDPAALLASVKKMTPMHVGVGVVLGFVLSPVIAAILATLLPLALFVALLAAAAVAYAKFKLNANINDWRLLSVRRVARQGCFAHRRGRVFWCPASSSSWLPRRTTPPTCTGTRRTIRSPSHSRSSSTPTLASP